MTRFHISLDGANLKLHIPSARDGSTLEYSITFPCTAQGAKSLRRAIMERDKQPHGLLGTDASPTQRMVEEWLANGHEVVRPQTRIEAVASKIDTSSIDLTL